MSQSQQCRRRRAVSFTGLVHELNQRYKEAWDRAERLQAELDNIKGSRAWRLLIWWRRLAFWRRSAPAVPPSSFRGENLEACRVRPAGTVSMLIPFKDRLDLLRNCLKSLRRSSYPYQVVLIDNGSTNPRTCRYLQRLEARHRGTVVRYPGPFNFSRLCNLGARQATGDFLVFLNNDVKVLATDWLERLLELAGNRRIGAVGATLLYPNKTIQHAGIFPTQAGEWTHAYRGLPQDHGGDQGELRFARSVPAVTGACLMIRRDLFFEMGGYDERYPVTFNDVDLCCRLRQRGLTVAVTPHARLWHFESLSRGYTADASLQARRRVFESAGRR
jgi:GT2 family glycosyltransferase